jgi:hypothetical protein
MTEILMEQQKTQTLANHARFDPTFHFFLIPIFAINAIVSIWNLVKNPGLGSAWIMVVSFAAVVAVFKMRIYALKVQDRVIRLEERLRLEQLAPERLRPRICELTEGQLIALRFADDSEIAELAEKTLADRLPPKQIKQTVRSWRPDYWRV